MSKNLSIRTFSVSLLIAWLATPMASALADGALLPSVQSRTDKVIYERPPGVPSDAELETSGARIGEVRIDTRAMFDTGNSKENTSLFRLANRLHIGTRDGTVTDQLLFRSGEPYARRLLDESERMLRTNHFLRDAVVRPVAYRDGVVDVEVVTQDVWTFNPGVSFGRKGGRNTSGFELEELNLLGLGTQLGIGYKSGLDRDSKTIFYRDRQLGSSWWSLSTTYSDNSDGRLGELSVEHPFYALDSRWAGGISLRDDQRIDSRYDRGEIIDEFARSERFASVYYGRATGLRDGWTRRLTFGATWDATEFSPSAQSLASRIVPSDRTLAFPWIGVEWIQDEFLTERNRTQIERIEDVAMGWRVRGQLGISSSAFGADRTSLPFEAGLSRGLRPTPRQTLLFDAGTRGRFEDSRLAATITRGAAQYFFRQSDRRLLYLGLSGEFGSKLDLDQQILLGGDSGLRGYPLRYQAGEGRWLFTAEQRLFTNWYPFRLMNVGAAVFYDMGGTWGRDPLGAPSQGVLKDFGVGLRLGNSRSALGNVVHIDVAMPLDGDSSIRNVQFIVETKRSF